MASRGAFIKVLIAAVLVGLAACVGYAVSYPQRWNEDLTGMRRNDAWRLLGVPDVDYTEKGFDGWNRNAIFGAWVLIVRYGENERISGVERKFSWGLDYLSWDADYRKQWKRPNSAMDSDTVNSALRASHGAPHRER